MTDEVTERKLHRACKEVCDIMKHHIEKGGEGISADMHASIVSMLAMIVGYMGEKNFGKMCMTAINAVNEMVESSRPRIIKPTDETPRGS